MRGALGLDPFQNAAADRPMVLTPTGYVPIEAGVSSPPSSPAGRVPRGASAAGIPLTRGSMRPHGSTDLPVEPGNDPSLHKYSPDQPRVPAGNPDGGQWTSEGTGDFLFDGHDSDGGSDETSPSGKSNVQVAADWGLPCDGYAGGCQSGGTYGTNAMYRIRGLNLCRNCAVKILGIENAPSNEQVDTLDPFSIQRK